jgi:hypothetical protein
MKWFFSCFQSTARSAKVAPSLENIHYKGAGILFTDKINVLAGFQPNKRIPKITGIGGTRNGSEPLLDCALRECIEELYDINVIPAKLFLKLKELFHEKQFFITGWYINYVFSFEDLRLILKIVKRYKLLSPVYDILPTTIEELLLKRKHSSTAEIQSIVFLPIACLELKYNPIGPEFIQDIQILKDINKSDTSQ